MDEKLLTEMLAQLVRIGDALESMARSGEPAEPNLVKPLGEYAGFDWSSIGSSIVNQDPDGPTHLESGGFIWTRRSPVNKFEPAIWFSRPAGKDAEGNTRYLRLVTFREISGAEPLSEKARQKSNPAHRADKPEEAARQNVPPGRPAQKTPAAVQAGADSGNIPDKNAWDAWQSLVDKAEVLGIETPWPKTGISTDELRQEYGRLVQLVKEAENKSISTPIA